MANNIFLSSKWFHNHLMFLAITKWTHLWFLSVSLFEEASASLSREEYNLLLYCPSLLGGRTELSISSGGWRDTVSNLLQPRRLCIYCTAHLGGWASTSNTVGKAPDFQRLGKRPDSGNKGFTHFILLTTSGQGISTQIAFYKNWISIF